MRNGGTLRRGIEKLNYIFDIHIVKFKYSKYYNLLGVYLIEPALK